MNTRSPKSYAMIPPAHEADVRRRGIGGAVFTAGGAVTTFDRKAIFRTNRSGGAGGALHNDVGARTTLKGSVVFSGNTALSVSFRLMDERRLVAA